MNARNLIKTGGASRSAAETAAGNLLLSPDFRGRRGRGAAPATRCDPAAGAITLRLRAQGMHNGLALAADAVPAGATGSSPPGAKPPARLEWDSRERVPTWFLLLRA